MTLKAQKIKILGDREHIRRRPNMYVGSTTYEPHTRFIYGEYKTVSYVPGIVKIIDEIIDNSVDEAIRTDFKFANKIDVSIDGGVVTIKDNGRGIPQDMIEDEHSNEIPGPVAAWTKARSGGNFDDDESRKTQGMNGVGSALTNFFSEWFVGTTCDGKNTITVNCTDGASNVSWKSKSGGTQGTTVQFMPDFESFDGMSIDKVIHDIINDRLISLSVVFPDIQFRFNGKKVNMNFKHYAACFDKNPLVLQNDNVSLALCTSPDGFRHVTYVNGLHLKNGGVHIDCVIDDITEELIKGIKRKHGIEVTKARIKESLTLIMIVRNMTDMRFDSQTKERLTNPMGAVRNHLAIDSKKLARMILNSPELIDPIIAAALARKMAAEQAALTKAQKKAAKIKVAKHIKAGEWESDKNTILFLAEGDSAIGPLLKVRDPALHGGYALRGKVMTTWGMKEADIIQNAEIRDIMAITGLRFGMKEADANELKYQNIAILVDADVDGMGSIYPALVAFFARWPWLFKQQRIRFIKTPLWIAEKGKGTSKDVKWYYADADFVAAGEHKGYEVRYIKGLGSLREYEYRKVINEPVYDIVDLGDNYKEIFDMLYGDDTEPRKVWMSK